MTVTSDPVCPRVVCRRGDAILCWDCPGTAGRQLALVSAPVAGSGPGVLPQVLADFHDVHRVVFVKYVRSRGVSDEEAEDVVSQAFLALYRAGRSFLSADNPLAFGFKVLRDVVADHFRAVDRRPRTLALAAGGDHPATAVADGGISELICRLDVDKALELLPPQQADCLRLCLFQDLSPTQIAYYLGIKRSTVSSHLSAGRRQLAGHLESYRPQNRPGPGKEQHG